MEFIYMTKEMTKIKICLKMTVSCILCINNKINKNHYISNKINNLQKKILWMIVMLQILKVASKMVLIQKKKFLLCNLIYKKMDFKIIMISNL